MGDTLIILFDLDGTLIDSTEAILESFHNSLRVHNQKKVSDELIKEQIGYPLDIMFANVGVKDELVWDLVDTYREHYRVISTAKTTLLPYAKEAIVLAKSFADIGIVTTKTALYSKELMEHFSVMEFFDVLIGREDVINPKPHPEPILKALNSFEVKDKDIWMIGDTKLDLLSAKEAKVNSIGVLSGYGSLDSLQKHTKNIFDTTLEAVEFLEQKATQK